MENQILAHLSSRFGKQHEVVATEGLAYILQQSDSCRRYIEELCVGHGCNLPAIDLYEAEVTGESLERPDVVGYSAEGKQLVIIEGKFEAGLTENQPNNYLKRLPDSEPGILIFAVPEHRITSISRVIAERTVTDFETKEFIQLADGSVCQDIGSRHKLLVISWKALLNHLLLPAQRLSKPITADILQLQSLCERIEGESFLPFLSEELTSTRIARRHRDLCSLVDAITDRVVGANLANTTGLKATPQRDGYKRYISLGDNYATSGASVSLDYTLWIKSEISPIWFASGKEATARFRPIVKRIALASGVHYLDNGNSVMIPLTIESNQEFADIVKNAADRIASISALLEKSV